MTSTKTGSLNDLTGGRNEVPLEDTTVYVRYYDRRLAINIETFATITGLIQDKVNRACVHTCSDRTVTGSSIVKYRRGLRNMRHPSLRKIRSSEMPNPANSDDDC